MYLLPQYLYDECLQAEHLVRFALAQAVTGLEPSPVVKANSLSLK
jgi:hypothetical protein